jgi:hypothetical protein
MRNLQAAGAILAIALLASCAPRPAPPTPAPPPPAPAPEPAPPPPAPADWRDAPLSDGDWSYRSEGRVSSAEFGPTSGPNLVLRCEASRQLSLTRVGAAGGGALTIRTTFGERTLSASAQPGGLVAGLAASDPLLDQIVFSRGRFLVQAAGAPPLIVPAWPEPAQVIEDCRG